jgi:glycosyltransferase involved in cell wall biosynthesis
MGKEREQINGAIALASNSPGIPTGYGTQGAQFLERALRHGMKCASLSNYGLEGNIGTVKVGKHTIPHYPKGFHPYSADVLPGWFQHFDKSHNRDTVLMTLYDVWVFEQLAKTFKAGGKDIPIVSWVPLDHVSLPGQVASFLRRPNVTPVTMAPHGQRQLEKAGIESTYIPHAIDVHTYKPTEKMSLVDMTGREYILGDKQDVFLVGMVSANKANGMVHRKSFAENFAAFALFRKLRPDAVLYVHADPSPVMGGFTLPMLAQAFGLEPGAIIFPDPVQHRLGYSDADMAALYTSMDVLLHANMGEGFGLTSIEAQACGTRVITSSWAASPDLASEDCFLVDGQPWWNEQLKAVSQVPNISSIVRALELAYNVGRERSEKSRKFALQFDADKVWDEKWLPFWRKVFA